MTTETQATLRSASIISASALVGAMAGFALQLLVAAYFGADTDTDAFFMAQSTGELVQKLLLGGSIAAVFVPMFVERLSAGDRQTAWHLGLNLLHVAGAAMVVAVIVIGIFADTFVGFIAPGFDAISRGLTVQLLYILLPSFAMLFLVDLSTAMLHALKHFLAPALLRIVAPTTSALVLVLLAPSLGIASLAIGVLAGSILQLLILQITLRRLGLRYQFVFQLRDPALANMVKLVYPFVFAVLMTQAAGIVYRILVSDLDAGSLAALKFAEKITQLLAVMFLSSITAVIYPVLSEKAAQQDWQGLRDTMAHACRLIFFVTMPIMVGIAQLADPLVAIIYQRGKFDVDDAYMTIIALIFLVIGLTGNGISSVFGHAVLAMKKTKISVAVTVASQAIAIGLFIYLVPRMGHAGLALGSSLTPIAIALLYFAYLAQRIERLHMIFQHETYAKVLALAGALFVLIEITRLWLNGLAPYSLATVWLHLTVPAVLGGLFYFGIAHVWRIPEMAEVTTLLQNKFKRS